MNILTRVCSSVHFVGLCAFNALHGVFALVAKVLLLSVSVVIMEEENNNWGFLLLLAGDDWNCAECAGNEKTGHTYG